MKKILSLLVVGMFLIGFVACNNTKKDEAAVEETVPAEETVAAPEAEAVVDSPAVVEEPAATEEVKK